MSRTFLKVFLSVAFYLFSLIYIKTTHIEML